MDLLLQTSTQSHCKRIAQYYRNRQDLQVFPPGPFADSVEELGPLQSHISGPCLLLFENMHLSPTQFNAWISGSFVERPCCRVYWLLHSIPAQPDRQALVEAIIKADVPQGLTAVRLDAYPKSMELQIGAELEAAGYSAAMHPAAYSHVLFVMHMPDTGLWRWSYMEKQELWRHQPDQPARFSKSVATAINKIAEAMQVLGLHHPGQQHHCSNSSDSLSTQSPSQHPQQQLEAAAPPLQAHNCPAAMHPTSLLVQAQHCAGDAAATGDMQQQLQQQQALPWAIDVGACPGGWTSYLADSCGYRVIAIDPAELHPDVTARPGVHHIKAKAADALEEVDRLLQGQRADLLVCDANDHITQLPQFLGPVLPKLKSGGWLVLTLKFYGRGEKSPDVADKLTALLPDLEPGKCVWLLANTLCERTYIARKK